MNQNTYILFIDDNFSQNYLITKCKKTYGEDHVLMFKDRNEGQEYILSHLNQRMIIFLDWDFGENDPNGGIELFKTIHTKTSLVYVILMTEKRLDRMKPIELIEIINCHPMNFLRIKKTEGTKPFEDAMQKAEDELSARLDCVLQEWILDHPDDTFNKPYMTDRNGKVYNLTDILTEIRKGNDSPKGLELQRKILLTAIDLLTRNKRQLDA